MPPPPSAAAELALSLAPTADLQHTFVEHEDLKAILLAGQNHFDIQTVCDVRAGKGPALLRSHFPVFTAAIGSRDPQAPAVGFFGGIHGLERIGSQVILHYMRALLFRLEWDELLHRQLEKVRLVFMPIVNPGGMWAHKRANPNGVDLMRNAPQRAESRVPFLAGGQTLSPLLPWYCGRPHTPMEIESAALLQVVRGQLASRPFSLALDCHSGYGFDDSIWFPYAKTRRLMSRLPEMFALKTMLEQSHPHHDYSFEPQSNQYLLHGDLWDHAYDNAPAANVFLPMTLELGSWLWIRKNPRQLFSRHGIFNPIKAHRIKRVLRRHADLLDFLTRAAYAAPGWLPDAQRRVQLQQLATAFWRPRRTP
ncbi:MAG: M14 family zinc carboxypeptidase [Pseudomonadota bacterium]